MLKQDKSSKSVSGKTSKPRDKTSKDPAFAERLKGKRRELGLNQESLAKMTGVSNTTLQNYESGQYPKGGHAIALAQTLACSLDWLLMGKAAETAAVVDLKTKLAELEARNAQLEAENKALLKEALRVYRIALARDLKEESALSGAPSAPSTGLDNDA
ncbi:MAG: helix-turn-helix domain-containing protein [Deltaproteobacteria bacterium]|nr:helix-turn-helix domain-containing protein [Deltaproteobacteria bacterium]